jgi:hypothetical protein
MTFSNPFKRAKFQPNGPSGESQPGWQNNDQPVSSENAHRREERAGRPEVAEDTIATNRVQVERKVFLISLKENPRGRFLRITEESGGRHNCVIIPATGLDDFIRVLTQVSSAGRDPQP